MSRSSRRINKIKSDTRYYFVYCMYKLDLVSWDRVGEVWQRD